MKALPLFFTLLSLIHLTTCNIYNNCNKSDFSVVQAGGHWGLSGSCPCFGYGTCWSSVNLNPCIRNSNGVLVKAVNGGFSATCNSCVLEANSVWLNCNCQRIDLGWQRARIDLIHVVGFSSASNNFYCL